MQTLPTCATGVPIFQVLPPEALLELTKTMRHGAFAKGQTIVSDGSQIEHLVVVARGRVKLVHVGPGGREQIVRTLGPGQFWGELALFAPTRQEGDLVAMEETAACLVPRTAVQALLQRYPQVAHRLVETLAQRLAEAEQLIADLGLRDVGQRLAAELVRAAKTGKVQLEGTLVRVPVSWTELAVKLGTTPESLSRRLKALVEQGILAHEEGSREVLILDRERLSRLAGK
ncbi:MAG: Crp/Fnr family transcriptional regulator [Chitinophagales bacterium]